jgi:hypothetical protein
MQQWEYFALKSPALIIGQVKVQGVVLEDG